MWCGMMIHQGIMKFCRGDQLMEELHLAGTINISNNMGGSAEPAIAALRK